MIDERIEYAGESNAIDEAKGIGRMINKNKTKVKKINKKRLCQ